MDQTLVSSWFHLHSSVPLSYVQPPESRPGKLDVAAGKSIPIIDLEEHDRAHTLQKIFKASKEYGFFQVINHGVSMGLIEDTLNIFKEFHAMPEKDKKSECSRDPNGRCTIYASTPNNKKRENHFWRDTLRHGCPASGEDMEYWPQKPAKYRELVREYTQELRRLGLEILELICEGLGFAPGYFNGVLTEKPVIVAHHYPPCPEPSLTLGAPKHKDPSLITILLQDKEINALQVFKDGEWIGVEPIPNAFVVNIGLLLQIISNGRLAGAQHRVVTNSGVARTTVAYFIHPSNETTIEPAKDLINSTVLLPKYKPISFEEFLRNYINNGTFYVEAELTLSECAVCCM